MANNAIASSFKSMSISIGKKTNIAGKVKATKKPIADENITKAKKKNVFTASFSKIYFIGCKFVYN